jgi:hypothetical protein
MEERNPVREHIAFFAEKNGQITPQSMKDAHTSQCIYKGVSLKVRAICNIMGEKPHTSDTLEKVINPSSTGIWKSDGTFDKEQFDKLASYGCVSSKNGYKRVITKQNFMDYLEERHGSKNTGNACHIFNFIPVSWKRITNGSIDELFEYFGNIMFDDEKAFTEDKLLEFYTNPNSVMNERIKKLKDDELIKEMSDCSIM